MKYWEEEFTLESEKGYKFRFKKMSPIDILATSSLLEMYFSSKDTEAYKEYLDDSLSACEVCINGAWVSVKDHDVWLPADIEEDYIGLRQITEKFTEKVIRPVFTKSGG